MTGINRPSHSSCPANRFPRVLLAGLVVWLVLSGCGQERADEGAIVQDAPRDTESTPRTADPSDERNAEDSADSELRELLHRLALHAAATDDPNRASRHFKELLDSGLYLRLGVSKLSGLPATVAYERYLDAYLKTRTRFLRSMAKASIVISTGAALRMFARADLDGRAFAISAASLGLSTASVGASLRGIEQIRELRAARRTGVLTRLRAARRYAKFSGWVYRASEELLIVLVADDLEERLNEHLAVQTARKALGDAIGEFLDAVNEAGTLEAAMEAHSEAWEDYRNFLYRSLIPYEEEFERCVSRVARDALMLDTRRRAMTERLPDHPALKRNIETRFPSIEAYIEHSLIEDRGKIDEDAAACLATYNSQREERLSEIYEDNRRNSRLLEGIDLNSIRGRELTRASENRIQTYEDELDVLAAIAHGIRELDLEADLIEAEIAVVERMKTLDANLFGSSGLADSRNPNL
ncbi:MAG: hypothetical protein V3V11_04090 [Vicinamibacteria bacterium]